VSNLHHLVANGYVSTDGTVLRPIVMRTLPEGPAAGAPAAVAEGGDGDVEEEAAAGGAGAAAPAAGGAGTRSSKRRRVAEAAEAVDE
jgi:hypothetical protein